MPVPLIPGNEAAAEEELARLLTEATSGADTRGTGQSFGDLVEQWHASWSGEWSPETAKETRRLIDTKLTGLARVKLHKITPASLDAFHGDLRRRGARAAPRWPRARCAGSTRSSLRLLTRPCAGAGSRTTPDSTPRSSLSEVWTWRRSPSASDTAPPWRYGVTHDQTETLTSGQPTSLRKRWPRCAQRRPDVGSAFRQGRFQARAGRAGGIERLK